MSNTVANLRRKIRGAADLQSVVRTMKAVSASSIGQYENSVRALTDYYRNVELGLGAFFRDSGAAFLMGNKKKQKVPNAVCVIVFGSDQGLVGQFNDIVADYTMKAVAAMPAKPEIRAVGERVYAHLADSGLKVAGLYTAPNSIKAITTLVGQILLDRETQYGQNASTELYLFYNHPGAGAIYEPVSKRLLPLDEKWRHKLENLPWPTKNPPEILGGGAIILRALVREYLFVSLFRASAESLASENASRLAAMQCADKNIEELLVELNGTYHRIRQSGIDEELFDVISGFEALSTKE